MKSKKIIFFLSFLFIHPKFLQASPASSNSLSISQYLEQVKEKNNAFLSAAGSSEGSKQRSEESRILYSPNFFITAQYTKDKSPTLSYYYRDNQVTRYYNIGFSQNTGFGLLGKIYYSVSDNKVNGATYPAYFPENGTYVDTHPTIELTQSLWKNGFGSETRAQVQLQTSSALVTHHQESYRSLQILLSAERLYWRLHAATESLKVIQSSKDRAEKILAWQTRRANLQLSDRSDLLQAQAAVQLKNLDLKYGQEELRNASLAFNVARNRNAENIEEQLISTPQESLLSVKIPQHKNLREDVLAAEAASLAAQAAAQIGKEKQKPTLELFANSTLYGRESKFSASSNEAFSLKYPTSTIGIRFSTPLNFGLLSDASSGYQKDLIAAQSNYEHKVLEEQADWKDTKKKLQEALERLKLVYQIEKIQKEKMLYERTRQEKGRTTTYQVLVFEQDYANAQLTKIRTEVEVLNLFTQIKSFGVDL